MHTRKRQVGNMKPEVLAPSHPNSPTMQHSQTDPERPKSLQIRNVLVPVDFSSRSIEALEFTHPLARHFRANLHLIHVFEPDYPLAALLAMPMIAPETEIAPRVRQHLEDLAKGLGIDVEPDKIHALKGSPFEEICRFARESSIDLIVTATRGNTGLQHLALGSTAERIVRYAPCPVLVARPGKGWKETGGNGGLQKSDRPFRRIVVPVDFSTCSMKGLAYARSLAREFDARLHLLNSVAVQYYLTSDEYARFDLPLLMREAEETAREQMSNLMHRTDWEGLEVESSLEVGHAGERICTLAEKDQADLIVTATHGRTGLKHILLGSTAEYVVQHAPCSVMVVPSHDRGPA